MYLILVSVLGISTGMAVNEFIQKGVFWKMIIQILGAISFIILSSRYWETL